MKYCGFILSAVILLSGISTGVSAFEITEKTAIIMPEKPLASTILAADELEKYVKKVSGIQLTREKKNARNFIYIGLASDFKSLPSSLTGKLAKAQANDAYIFHAKGNRMFLAGKSKTGELIGVYQFLDRELGIRFFKPANKFDDGEYIPFVRRKSIPIRDNSFVQEPSYRRRLVAQTGWNWSDHPVNGIIFLPKAGYQTRAAYYHHIRGKRVTKKHIALYAPRTEEIWEDNHHDLFQKAVPAKKYFKTHPQYFAQINGKRQISDYQTVAHCLSNPEVRQLVADYIIKTLKDLKKRGITLQQGAGLSDMIRGWCECAECLKENGNKKFDPRDITVLYQRTFKDIFARVYKVCPDAELMLWGYGSYRIPPAEDFKLDKRIHFAYMPHGRCYAHTFDDPSCSRNVQLLKWMRIHKDRFQQKSIYEYFLCSGGRNYIPYELDQVHDLKFFYKEGFTGWEEEIFFEDSVYWRKNVDSTKDNEKLPSLWQWLYLTGKMLWNIHGDPVKILEDAESKYYAKSYPAMKKYHALRRKLWNESKNCFGYPFGNQRLPGLLNVPENKEQLFKLLDEAEKLANGDKKLLYRIGLDRKFLTKYWVKANMDYKKFQGNIIQAPSITGTPIVIDGKDDEKVWKDAFYVTDFRETFSRDHKKLPAEIATTIGVLSDSKYLYFLVKGKEPQKDKQFKKARNFWEKSSVEIFIHPQTESNEYYHIAYARDGEIYEARCPGNVKFKIGAEYKYSEIPGGYIMEIKVPAWKLGDFRNGSNWKCSFGVNRFIFTDKLVRQLYSLGGYLSHDVTKLFPMQIGSTIEINGRFNKTEKNKHKYSARLKVLEKVPASWRGSLPKKEGAVFGIKMEPSPYDETLYIANCFASRSLYGKVKEGQKLRIQFEAKGKGRLSGGIIRYQKTPYKFIRTEYPAKKDFILTDKWQKFSLEYTLQKNEYIDLAFNAFRCEAQIDNVNIIVHSGGN